MNQRIDLQLKRFLSASLIHFDILWPLGDETCFVASWQALADPYFKGLARVEREPTAQPVTKMEFEFERRRITKEDVRELIYREILEYHPKMLKEYLEGSEPMGFMYPRC